MLRLSSGSDAKVYTRWVVEPGGLREPGGLEEPGGLKEPGGLEFFLSDHALCANENTEGHMELRSRPWQLSYCLHHMDY